MSIKEALVRQSHEDKVDIGNVVKRALNGKFGEVLRAYINGVTTEEIENSRMYPDKVNADRALGRIEGYQKILIDLEIMVSEMEILTAPIIEDKEEEVSQDL